MNVLLRILGELLKLRAAARRAPASDYRRGYLDALDEAVEIVEEELD